MVAGWGRGGGGWVVIFSRDVVTGKLGRKQRFRGKEMGTPEGSRGCL